MKFCSIRCDWNCGTVVMAHQPLVSEPFSKIHWSQGNNCGKKNRSPLWSWTRRRWLHSRFWWKEKMGLQLLFCQAAIGPQYWSFSRIRGSTSSVHGWRSATAFSEPFKNHHGMTIATRRILCPDPALETTPAIWERSKITIGGNQTLKCILFIRLLTFCFRVMYCCLLLKMPDFLGGQFNCGNNLGVEQILITITTPTLLYTLEATI